MDDGEELPGDRPAAASTTLDACSFTAALAEAESPLWVWKDPDGHAHLGTGEAVRIVAEGATRFGTLEDGLEALTDRLPTGATGPRAFVGGRFFHEPPRTTSGWDPYPTTVATVPSVQLGWAPDGTVELTVVEVDGPTDLDARLATERNRFEGASEPSLSVPTVTDRTYQPSPDVWRDTVASMTESLRRPPLEKAVLAAQSRIQLDDAPSTAAVVDAMTTRHPDCWLFAHAPTDGSMFVGATPERLATVEDDQLQTVALAGSIGRGETSQEDASLRDSLIEREDDRHEQAAVVGDIVARIGSACEAIRIEERRIRTLSDVQHIETPISATLREGVGLLDIAGRLHPTPAVGGRPRASALALIRELEIIERGWYAAPIGIVDPAGDGTLAVGIRSARIDGDQATLFAGNGIVTASEPTAEWEELLLKFQAIGEIFDGR